MVLSSTTSANLVFQHDHFGCLGQLWGLRGFCKGAIYRALDLSNAHCIRTLPVDNIMRKTFFVGHKFIRNDNISSDQQSSRSTDLNNDRLPWLATWHVDFSFDKRTSKARSPKFLGTKPLSPLNPDLRVCFLFNWFTDSPSALGHPEPWCYSKMIR